MAAAVALHPNAAPGSHQPAEICTVAQLADEAGGLLAAWHGLNAAIAPHPRGSWIGLSAALGEPEPADTDEEACAVAVQTEITERVNAITGIALHHRAASTKGAAFQALVLNLHLTELLCTGLDSGPTPEQRESMNKSNRQIERGLVSIIQYLASAGGELPPHLVNYYMMASRDQPSISVARAVEHFRRK